jgi:hypothetical protein
MVNTHIIKPLYFEDLESKQFKDLVRHHADHDEMSSAEYLASYQSVLGRSMDRQAKIYLDTLVWVRLKETVLGKGKPEEEALLECLRKIVRQRKGLCVSHFHSLMEVGRQTEASLRVTTGLLQELTEGVVLVSPDELRAWECAQFVHEVVGCPAPPTYMKWTKVGFSHRSGFPRELLPANASERGVGRTMKMATDHFWNVTFDQIFEAFSWDTKSKLAFDIDTDVITNLEDIRKSNRANGRTFQSDRTPAFDECIDKQLLPIFEDVLAQHGCLNHWNLNRVLEAASGGFHKNKLGRHLGLSRLMVELYVHMVTADRPLASNDYVDWAHAGAALPNCDVFITERYMAHQLTQELRADKTYGCEVVSSAAAATKLLTDRFL